LIFFSFCFFSLHYFFFIDVCCYWAPFGRFSYNSYGSSDRMPEESIS